MKLSKGDSQEKTPPSMAKRWFRLLILMVVVTAIGKGILHFVKKDLKKNQKTESDLAGFVDPNCEEIGQIEDFSSFLGLRPHFTYNLVADLLGKPDKQTEDSAKIKMVYIGSDRTAISLSFLKDTKAISSAIVWAGNNQTESDLKIKIRSVKKLGLLNKCEADFLGASLEEISDVFGTDYNLSKRNSPKGSTILSAGYVSEDHSNVVLFSIDSTLNRCNGISVTWRYNTENRDSL